MKGQRKKLWKLSEKLPYTPVCTSSHYNSAFWCNPVWWQFIEDLFLTYLLVQTNVNYFFTHSIYFVDVKVKTLWEGHKIWKNLPPFLTKQLFSLSIVKTSGRFFQIFVDFSEKLDFKHILCMVKHAILLSKISLLIMYRL